MPEDLNQFEGTGEILNEDMQLSTSHGTSTLLKSSGRTMTVEEFEQLKRELLGKMNKIKGDAENNFKKLEDQTKQNVEKNQLKLLEVLGIYISLFTFISASIQIFARISDLFSAIFVLLIVLFSLLLFLSLSDIILFPKNKDRSIWKEFKWGHFPIVCVVFLLVIFVSGFLLNKKFNSMVGTIEFAEEFEKWTDEKVNEKFINYTTTTDNLIKNLSDKVDSIEEVLR